MKERSNRLNRIIGRLESRLDAMLADADADQTTFNDIARTYAVYMQLVQASVSMKRAESLLASDEVSGGGLFDDAGGKH